MRPRIWEQTLLALLALSVLVGVVGAQAGRSWSEEGRKIEFHQDANGFRFASTRPDAPSEERLSGVFDLQDARFNWGFQANRSAPTHESGIVFSALLEWRDADGDGAFGLGDEVVRRQPIDRLGNATLEVLPQPPAGRIVHATYPFPGGRPGPLDPITGRRVFTDGGVTLSFHLFEAGATLGAQQLDPARLPLDVRIEKWPRTRNETRIGLELHLQSMGPTHVGAQAWHASHDGIQQDLTWSTEYTRNGSSRAAQLAALERPGDPGFGARDAQTTLLAAYEAGNILQSFSFGTEPQAQDVPDLTEIVHDLVGDPRLYAAGAAGCALIVGATAARKMRRRG